jgi:hypothetical protein
LTADLGLLLRLGFGHSSSPVYSAAGAGNTAGPWTFSSPRGPTRGTLCWNIHVSTNVQSGNNELAGPGNGFSFMRSPNVKPNPILVSLGSGMKGLAVGLSQLQMFEVEEGH